MLYTGDKTYSKTSKFGLYKYNQYEENKKDNNVIKIVFVAICIVFSLILVLLCLYYLPNQNKNKIQSSNKPNQPNITSNYTIKPFNNFTATALPFFSSLFSQYMEEPRQLNRKITSNEKQPTEDARKLDKHPHHDKRIKNIQDILGYYDEQRNNDEGFDYRGMKFKSIYRHPEVDVYGTPEYGYKNSIAYERPPFDSFYRHRPLAPGDVNMLAPNSYRFSPTLFRKQDVNKQIKPVSLMLDIYPMSQNDEITDKTSIINLLTKPILQAIPLHNNPPKTEVTTPYPYEKITIQPKSIKNEESPPNKMVVHLNLYPRKRQKHQKKKLNRHIKINPAVLMKSQLLRQHRNNYVDLLVNEEYQDEDADYDEYYDMLPRMDDNQKRDRKIDYDLDNLEPNEINKENFGSEYGFPRKDFNQRGDFVSNDISSYGTKSKKFEASKSLAIPKLNQTDYSSGKYEINDNTKSNLRTRFDLSAVPHKYLNERDDYRLGNGPNDEDSTYFGVSSKKNLAFDSSKLSRVSQKHLHSRQKDYNVDNYDPKDEIKSYYDNASKKKIEFVSSKSSEVHQNEFEREQKSVYNFDQYVPNNKIPSHYNTKSKNNIENESSKFSEVRQKELNQREQKTKYNWDNYVPNDETKPNYEKKITHLKSSNYFQGEIDIGVKNSSEMEDEMKKLTVLDKPTLSTNLPPSDFSVLSQQIELKPALPIPEEVLREHLQRLGVKNTGEVGKRKPEIGVSIIPPQILHNKFLTTPVSSIHWDLNQLKEGGMNNLNHLKQNGQI